MLTRTSRETFIAESKDNGVDEAAPLPFSTLKEFLASFQFPTTIAQALSSGHNQIFAITGPIATGKSTLSRSLFAHQSLKTLSLPIDRYIYSRTFSSRKDSRDTTLAFPYGHFDMDLLTESVIRLKAGKSAIVPFWNHATGNRIYLLSEKLGELQEATALNVSGYELVETPTGTGGGLDLLTNESQLYVDRNTGELLEVVPQQQGTLIVLDSDIAGAIKQASQVFDYTLFVWQSRKSRKQLLRSEWDAGRRHHGEAWDKFEETIENDYFRVRDKVSFSALTFTTQVIWNEIAVTERHKN